MPRLTNYDRDIVLTRLLDEHFGPMVTALKKEEAVLAEAVLTRYLGDRAELFASCPPEWFENRRQVYWSVRGNRYTAWFDREVPVPCAVCGCSAPDRPDLADLAGAREDLERRVQKLKSDRKELSTKVRAILNAAPTIAALLRTWPEVEPYLPRPAAPISLPVPLTAELNAALGLPRVLEDAR